MFYSHKYLNLYHYFYLQPNMYLSVTAWTSFDIGFGMVKKLPVSGKFSLAVMLHKAVWTWIVDYSIP